MECRALHELLLDLPLDAAGSDLPGEAEEHLAGCASCRDLRASYARLDRLLITEPAPPAPLDLMTQVLEAVALRRARDLAWARRQLLVLVAAAAVLVVGLGLALGGGSAPDLVATTARARADLDAGLSAVEAGVEALLAGGLTAGERWVGGWGALPSPPLVLLVVLAPALLLLDSLVCRASPRARGTS